MPSVAEQLPEPRQGAEDGGGAGRLLLGPLVPFLRGVHGAANM